MHAEICTDYQKLRKLHIWHFLEKKPKNPVCPPQKPEGEILANGWFNQTSILDYKTHIYILQNQLVPVHPGWAAARSSPRNQTYGQPCPSGRLAAPSPSPSAPAAPSSSSTPPFPPAPCPLAAVPAGWAAPGVSFQPQPSPAELSSGFAAAPPQPGAGAQLPVDAAAVEGGERRNRGTRVHRGRWSIMLTFSLLSYCLSCSLLTVSQN